MIHVTHLLVTYRRQIELAVGMSMVSTLEKEIETLRADKRALESSNRALQEQLDAAQAKNTQMTQELDYFKHANASQQQLQQVRLTFRANFHTH